MIWWLFIRWFHYYKIKRGLGSPRLCVINIYCVLNNNAFKVKTYTITAREPSIYLRSLKSKNDLGCHICIMWPKHILVKYEKYGTLSIFIFKTTFSFGCCNLSEQFSKLTLIEPVVSIDLFLDKRSSYPYMREYSQQFLASSGDVIVSQKILKSRKVLKLLWAGKQFSSRSFCTQPRWKFRVDPSTRSF